MRTYILTFDLPYSMFTEATPFYLMSYGFTSSCVLATGMLYHILILMHFVYLCYMHKNPTINNTKLSVFMWLLPVFK